MKKLFQIVAVLVAATLLYSPSHAATRIILASTTSTQNSGLFDVLLPAYYKWTKLKDVRLDVVAVGTGKAIEIAKRGDADILLVHDPEKEAQFMAWGFGAERHKVMYNDFIIVGPASDPAGVKKARSAGAALSLIAVSGVRFVSRGDESGTHAREKKLWPKDKAWAAYAKGKSYVSVGQGMEQALRMADEMDAYTLSDRGTFLALKDSLRGLKLLYEDGTAMLNQYSVVAVNPTKFPHVHYKESLDFIDFLTGPAGQSVIGGFRDKAGNRLFEPNAGK